MIKRLFLYASLILLSTNAISETAQKNSVLEFYDKTNPEPTASKGDIAAYAYGFQMACLKQSPGTQDEKNKFCKCVSDTIEYNMIHMLSPTEAKQTIRGSASGIQPIPNAQIVYFGIKETCYN